MTDGFVNAHPFRRVTTTDLKEFPRPSLIEHVSTDSQILAGQRQEGGGAQHTLRLNHGVVVHEQDMGGVAYFRSFEKTTRKSAGAAEIVLFDKLESIAGALGQERVVRVGADSLFALIDDGDASQHFGYLRIFQEGRDVRKQQGGAIEGTISGDKLRGLRGNVAGYPFRSM